MCTPMASKLARSKATGLMNPVSLFVPWCVFMHILILIRGYFAAFPAKLIWILQMETISKLFSPARFSGECCFAYRHFKKILLKGKGTKMISVYNGRSAVFATESTLLCVDYSISQQRVKIIQHYTTDDFVADTILQVTLSAQELIFSKFSLPFIAKCFI